MRDRMQAFARGERGRIHVGFTSSAAAHAFTPEVLRLCLVLSIVGGLPAHHIARVLGLSEAAVRQRLSRARKLFQQLYLLESGETIFDGSSLTQQVEVPDRRLTRTAPSSCAMAAAS